MFNPLNLIPKPYRLLAYAVAALLVFLAGFGAGWDVNGNRLEAKIATMEADAARNLAQATAQAMDQQAANQRRYQDAIAQANKRAASNARAADAARIERDRLRDRLAADSLALPGASCESARNYAATLSAVFGECSDAIAELGKKADGHAADARALREAWPE